MRRGYTSAAENGCWTPPTARLARTLLGGRPRCIQGDYTLRVATLLTSDELEKIKRSTLDKLRPLSLVQREIVIRAILEDDDRFRRRHRGFNAASSFALTVRRDGVM